MADKEYLDIVGFVTNTKTGKKRVVRCGYGYLDDQGGARLYLEATPAGNWDGSLLLQKRRERSDGNEPPPF